MTTVGKFALADLEKTNHLLSNIKVTVESAFYGNNVKMIPDLAFAYNLAKQSPNVTVTDLPVAHTEDLGLPADARVLVSNDGKVFGRTAQARRILGQPGIDNNYYAGILREAVFTGQKKTFYHGQAVVGLSKDFSVKAHLLLAEGYENNLYSWLLNFQIFTPEAKELYEQSPALNEDDLYIYANPDWSHPDFPNGLALFDPVHNVAAILGLRYFGELKKATLTLAWATAHRNGFVACHGGMKQYDLGDKKFTMAAFGLSGSGKSTITLAESKQDFPVKILHDDAFIISEKTGATTALEPSYFDKTQDYPATSSAIDYFLTVQNVGVTLDDTGRKVIVTEDIRNGNGRTVKSRYLTPNRVDFLPEKIDAVFWIMKDDALPPVVKINDPDLATVFGVTLATKRSTAENVIGQNLDQLVMEPFANPFRSYPLGEDYQTFKELFAQGVDCYILNTGFFNGNKVTPQHTLGAIDLIIQGKADFVDFGPIEKLEYLPIEGHPVDFSDKEYLNKIKQRLVDRLAFINEKSTEKEGYDALPKEVNEQMENLILDLAQKLAD
ncbi:phosphoenolpyruvate carboxykinase (ATP) [Enterococcus timonensis]|uniref:phosphoenolpyruvate carboxykinase (ATP) n=1 Tax=Enterococcus timonensis TaxID=1852364 RepID=UPI0008DAB3CA|nr:phosphoenolpyruvate carboxykinase (ATP) [Enterococcus timonensis]